MNIKNITNLDAEELNIYAHASEAELLHYYEPQEGVFIAETANVVLRALEAGYRLESVLVEDKRMEIEGGPVFELVKSLYGEEVLNSIPVYTAPLEVLNKLTGYNLVRGLWAVMRRKPLQPLKEFLAGKNRVAVLYDVVNPTNVGAIIRSAAALGMDGVLLTDHSVNPLTRRSSRVSMGTVFQIPWTVIKNSSSAPGNTMSEKTYKDDYETGNASEDRELLPEVLRKNGFATAVMALTENSITPDADVLKQAEKLAVFLGTEGDGLPKEIINTCDYRVMIPMMHGVDSLNVAAASAVIFWELAK